uniref:Myosin class ii heavy chain n=1 Tax=Macrostomum lignano TaxID=282301 RepID=A0A1I8JR04_9PLAT
FEPHTEPAAGQTKAESVAELVKTVQQLRLENAELNQRLASAGSAAAGNNSHLDEQLTAASQEKQVLVEEFSQKERALCDTIEQLRAELLQQVQDLAEQRLASFADIEIPPDLTSDFIRTGVKLDATDKQDKADDESKAAAAALAELNEKLIDTAAQEIQCLTEQKQSLECSLADERQRQVAVRDQELAKKNAELQSKLNSADKALKTLSDEKQALEKRLKETSDKKDQAIEKLKQKLLAKLDAAEQSLKQLAAEKLESERIADEEIQRKEEQIESLTTELQSKSGSADEALKNLMSKSRAAN